MPQQKVKSSYEGGSGTKRTDGEIGDDQTVLDIRRASMANALGYIIRPEFGGGDIFGDSDTAWEDSAEDLIPQAA